MYWLIRHKVFPFRVDKDGAFTLHRVKIILFNYNSALRKPNNVPVLKAAPCPAAAYHRFVGKG